MENTQTTTEDVIQQIKQVLVQDMQLNVAAQDIPDNYSLLESGLALDSILIAELIARIEDQFGVQFDDRIADSQLFNNLSSLAAFVSQELRAAQSDGGKVHPGVAKC